MSGLTRRFCVGSIATATPTAAAVTASALCMTHRSIRSVIPPRPLVTTLMYLDSYGRAVRSKTIETPLSLIRTRDNKFWLQRVMPDGEVIRWRALGLDHLKHATNFETYNLNEIDEYGGIVIPQDVMPTVANDPPPFQDAVYFMMHLIPGEKVTRKVRRQWHRRLAAHWKESPEKYFSQSSQYYVYPMIFALWAGLRFFNSVKNKKPFWDIDVYHAEGKDTRVDPLVRLKQFSDNHPEHEGYDDRMITMLSPGQGRLSSARAELRESDITDPHFHSELWWKIRHCRYYGHWPKSLTASSTPPAVGATDAAPAAPALA